MDTGYLSSVRKQFAYYKQLGDGTFAQLRDDELHWRHNAESNSVATIVKHLWGNMLSRWTDLLTTDGEKPWREREAEFDDDLPDRAAVLAKWEQGWACLFQALDALTEADLGRIVHIRNQGHTVMEAINRQLAHYPYHVGQIVQIGKMMRGADWLGLSIPRGGSAAFNADLFARPKQRAHFTDDLLAPGSTIPHLREQLREAHEHLWATVEAIGGEQQERALPGKWNALQHLEHIHLGVRAMGDYLALPKATITEKFGRMDRPSVDLQRLTDAYYARLAQGVVPPDRFMPRARTASELAGMIEQGRTSLARMQEALGAWTEDELDTFMCPHPAMGPLTAREMVMFTALHARHHRGSIERITG